MQFRLQSVLCLALAAAGPLSGMQAAEGRGQARVAAVQPSGVADLILLDAGFDAGLRLGMVCRVTRSGTDIAEVLLVEIRPGHCAALIASVAPQQSIRPGDAVAIKAVKS
jgi:hypothetical protein